MFLNTRASGVLLPLFSLPGIKYVGSLGRPARRFLDFLVSSGQSWWQMLPINPIDFVNSPYSSFSAFAGEPLYIDLEDLVQQDLLDTEDLLGFENVENTDRADYASARRIRSGLYRKAFERFQTGRGGDKYRVVLDAFRQDNRKWLSDYILFYALSNMFQTPSWYEWPKEFRYYNDLVSDVDGQWSDRILSNSALRQQIDYAEFKQLLFDVQWREFKQECNQHGISLLGDVPIYVGHSSADTWAHHSLFQMDRDGQVERVAGVPGGDNFGDKGQCWNSPLYNWQRHEATGFSWWIDRMVQTLKRFDAVRLDHFIGFYNYYSFSATGIDDSQERSNVQDPNYELGWAPGPQKAFFDAIFSVLPSQSFLAEDLGVMNSGVHQLRDHYRLPGMEVLQFSADWFHTNDPTWSWPTNAVVCTGTHDTQPILAWLADIEKKGPANQGLTFNTIWKDLLKYQKENEKFISDDTLQTERYSQMVDGWYYSVVESQEIQNVPNDTCPVCTKIRPEIKALKNAILRCVLNSRGNVALLPMQDILGGGEEMRINYPGSPSGNWSWRLTEPELNDSLAKELLQLTQESNRLTR